MWDYMTYCVSMHLTFLCGLTIFSTIFYNLFSVYVFKFPLSPTESPCFSDGTYMYNVLYIIMIFTEWTCNWTESGFHWSRWQKEGNELVWSFGSSNYQITIRWSTCTCTSICVLKAVFIYLLSLFLALN